MTAPLKARDGGVAVSPTARATVRAGMPASTPTTDAGVATATSARPNVFDPQVGMTNPPSATPDVGGA